MEGYIRKRTDFSTVLINVRSFDATLASIFEASSTIVADYKGGISQGDFVICDEYTGVVKQLDVSGKTMTLTCTDMDSAFDRLLHYDSDSSYQSAEEFIMHTMLKEYKMCDPMYSLDYLALSVPNTTTPFFLPNLTDKGMFSLNEYIKEARRKGANTQYDLMGERLIVSFKTTSNTMFKLDFSAQNTVQSESYGGYSLAKVSNFADGKEQCYYLLSDGTVSKEQNNSNRVFGAWEVVTDSTEDAVLQKFKITYGHEITFFSERSYPFLSPLQLKMQSGKVVNSFVATVRKKSGSDRYYYTAGELKTTLTSKLRG